MDWSFGDKSKKAPPTAEPIDKQTEPDPPALVRPELRNDRALELLKSERKWLRIAKPEPVNENRVIEEPVINPPEKRKRGRPKKSEQIAANSVQTKPSSVQIEYKRWEPTEEDFVLVRQLGELGWAAEKLYTAFSAQLEDGSIKPLVQQQFAAALVRHPQLKAEYEAGVEDFKGFKDRQLAWQPLPHHVELVLEYAKEGLRIPEIAAKLKVSRESLANRMADTPRLRAAYEEGDGHFRAKAIRKMKQMVDGKDEDLKFVAPMLKFQLQAYCELTDKAPEKPVVVTGAIQHNHTVKLATPVPVAPKNIGSFAAKEMVRAKEISKAKMLEMKPAEVEAVDGEVVE